MYEETLGTDWDRLEHDEAIRRAFALGVAEGFGSAPAGELDRLAAQVPGRYGRSLVELAYDEGRTKGRTPRPGSDEEVWADLVMDRAGAVDPGTPSPSNPAPRTTDRPGSLSAPSLLDPDRDDLARLDLPDFLR